ncbi:MAG TPA: branched-chain amino acid ABC transporter permease [Vicinamibacterales bacterium]|nr:branched-chain amino acid ABC transporter permease [Vicinamibacterales bacterium]
MVYLVTQTLNGLFSASLLFLIAGGLTLVFGVMRIVNIAHGSFYMLGVYIALTVVSRTGSLLAGAAAAVLVVGAIGFAMQRLLLERFAAQPLAQMMMTMGFALLARDAALVAWGGDPFTLPYPDLLRGSVEVGEVVFPIYRLFVIAVAAAVGVLLWIVNERTLVGARMRAAVDDPEMASACGIDVARLSGAVFGAGAALAAFGGVMGGPILGGFPGVDFDLLPLAFVVVIVGGMGSLKGAVAGSIVVGMIDNFGKALVPELSYFTLFAPMILVLAFKPTGLYGRAVA